MHTLLLQFLLALAVYTLLDVVWFVTVLQRYFFDSIAHLLNIQDGHVELRWLPAILVYVFLSLGVVSFVLPTSFLLYDAPIFLRGALFGLIVYGVYATTNGALLKKWPTSLMIVDVLWGALATGVTSLVVATMIH